MLRLFRDDHLLYISVHGLETFTQRKYNRLPYNAVCRGAASCASSAAVLCSYFLSHSTNIKILTNSRLSVGGKSLNRKSCILDEKLSNLSQTKGQNNK